ncbi:hypothetical protein [Pedobacter cryoconitis]|uniref:Uncharacterized protein n=1 Tax=Pedobacter cryoconitis TaxID=188932 RepID=A0A327SJ55_9SPHI|nr:hypothetical protein [Pedobacter cryoconitis]RAJ28861.1 hypothetical protein LY11_03135 [Pedobacter cryoconitis]
MNTEIQDSPKLQFGILMMLERLLPAFKTPTYADMKIIEGVLKTIESTDKSVIVKSIFDKYGITEGANVNGSHPEFININNEIMQADSQLTSEDIAVFGMDHLNSLTEGVNINYAERKALMELLVKK